MEMSENLPENVAETPEKPKKLTCKYCGAEFEKFYEISHHIRKEHPEKFIKKEPSPKPKEEESLFEKPKESWEILEEILTEYELNPKSVEFIVKRAKRVGGLHPMELQKILEDIKTGLESKRVIPYIIDDYYYALRSEQEKARKLGYHISYPLQKQPEEYAPTYGLGFTQSYQTQSSPPLHTVSTPYPWPQTYQPQPYQTQSYYPYPQPTLEEIAKIIDNRISQIIEKQREEERIANLQKEFDEKIKKQEEELKEKFEEIKSLISSIQTRPTEPEEKLTLEQIKQLLEDKEKSQIIELQQKQLEMQKLIQEEERKRSEEKISELTKKLDEMSKKIEEAKPVYLSTEGYNRDEVRLLADVVNILGQKKPLSELGQIIIRLQRPEETEKIREKVEGEDIYANLPKELLEGG